MPKKTQGGPDTPIFTKAEMTQHKRITEKVHDNGVKFVSKHNSGHLENAAHQFFTSQGGGAYL